MVRMLMVVMVVLPCVSGCGPSASWVRNPGPEDDGLRYYRPKPYILIAPASMIGEAERATAAGPPQGATYKLSLCYLPDFSEEYSVHIRPGAGASKLNVSLENGWNLTGINQDLNSKTSENLDSAAGLVRAFIPGGNAMSSAVGAKGFNPQGKAATDLPEVIVAGHEVPIGYYEAVVMRRPHDNSKRLAGFRYVGFLPIASGSCDTMAAPSAIARENNDPIYGLVFEKGVLVFKALGNFTDPSPD